MHAFIITVLHFSGFFVTFMEYKPRDSFWQESCVSLMCSIMSTCQHFQIIRSNLVKTIHRLPRKFSYTWILVWAQFELQFENGSLDSLTNTKSPSLLRVTKMNGLLVFQWVGSALAYQKMLKILRTSLEAVYICNV